MLSAIGDWLHGPECSTALPESPFGEAVGYCLNNWSALPEYARHGHLSIDNNPAERKLRPVAVGRKNYLFFGSDAGGRTAAAMYSVVSSAKRHGLLCIWLAFLEGAAMSECIPSNHLNLFSFVPDPRKIKGLVATIDAMGRQKHQQSPVRPETVR